VWSAAGLYFSGALNLPTGGTIVLTMVAAFVLVWVFTWMRQRVRHISETARSLPV